MVFANFLEVDDKRVWKQVVLFYFTRQSFLCQVKINGSNSEMLESAAEQFGGKVKRSRTKIEFSTTISAERSGGEPLSAIKCKKLKVW